MVEAGQSTPEYTGPTTARTASDEQPGELTGHMIDERHLSEQLAAQLTRGAGLGEIAASLASLSGPYSLKAKTEHGHVVARDHLGLTPVFMARDDTRGWMVADTVEEILHLLPEALHTLNEESVVAHISNLSAPSPGETFFSRIHAVEPGTVTRLESATPEPHRIWKPTDHTPDYTASIQTVSKQLRGLLTEVVHDQVWDGPIAATLSPGMDTAAVVAGLAGAGAEVYALTWTSPRKNQDEKEWADHVTAKLNVPLVDIPIVAHSLLPEEGIVTRHSTPFFDVFDQAWRLVYEEVATMERPILFTGLGGDHLFGRWVSAGGDLLLRGRLVRLGRYLNVMARSYPGLIDLLHGELGAPITRQVIPDPWTRWAPPPPWLHPARVGTWRKRHRELIGPGLLPGYAERVVGLTDGLIPQLAEHMSAQAGLHGIELRHPLLDRRLVEFALELPSWMLNNGSVDKFVLRQALADVLPKDTTDLEDILPPKLVRRAIRARETQLMALTQNMRSAALRYVSEPELAEYVEGFMRGEHDDLSFWNTLTFEDWLRRWW